MSRLVLPPARVEELASRTGARRTAVENFLSSLGEDRHEAYENMRADARSYRWNEATVGAICEGISEAEADGTSDGELLEALSGYLDSVEEDWARGMMDDELLEAIGRLDPEGERDDLTGPPGFHVTHLWREADRRGLLDRA